MHSPALNNDEDPYEVKCHIRAQCAPLTYTTTHPWDYHGGNTKRGEGGSHKGEKEIDFKILFR